MCLCFQKMNNFKESVTKGNEAVKILKDNKIAEDDLRSKIYSRLIKSLVSLKKPEEAVRVGQEGVEAVKDPSVINKELVKAKQLLQEEENKRKQMYAKMMKPSFRGGDGAGDAGAVPQGPENV